MTSKWIVATGAAVVLLGGSVVGTVAVAPLLLCEAVLDGVPAPEFMVDECEGLLGADQCRTGVGPEAAGTIPADWRSVFSAAGAEYGVNPNFLAALFLTENGNTWKPIDSTWPVSSAQAKGPMQFLDGTWAAYGVDGDGDGRKDVNDPDDAIFAAANLVAGEEYGPTTATTPVGTLNRPWTHGTLLFTAAQYNAGPGTIRDHTNAGQGLNEPWWGTNGGLQTKNYLRNVDALLNRPPILTHGGHPNYPGQVVGSESGTGAATATLYWPVDPDNQISSRFGLRPDPYGGPSQEYHHGLDFKGPMGDPIYAVADGKVVEARPSDGGFGQIIKIEHTIGGEMVQTWYAHMPSATEYVKKGDTVRGGERIASIGNSGRSTGPHLHLEVHPNGGEAIDPESWLASNGASPDAVDCPTGGGDVSGVTPPQKGPDGNWPQEACSVRPDPSTNNGCVTPRTLKMQEMLVAFGIPEGDIACYAQREGNIGEHPKGRACDITFGAIGTRATGADKANGKKLADFLKAHHDSWAVAYVIWYGDIWTWQRDKEGWRPYGGNQNNDPSSITGGHFDHVHVTVW